jgi:hypothetical protein
MQNFELDELQTVISGLSALRITGMLGGQPLGAGLYSAGGWALTCARAPRPQTARLRPPAAGRTRLGRLLSQDSVCPLPSDTVCRLTPAAV